MRVRTWKPLAASAAVVVASVSVYLMLLSPHARAKRLNVRMNETPMGEEWFGLLRELASTVDDPATYVRYHPPREHQGWAKKLTLIVARRLLRDGTQELVPGLVRILETAATGNMTDPRAIRDLPAAVFALHSIGGEARPALPHLIGIVKEGYCLEDAISALGRIGDTSACPVLVECLTRTGLQSWERDRAKGALIEIADLPSATEEALTALMGNADSDTRRRAALVLGHKQNPAAAPVLVELITEDFNYHTKSEIVDVLKCYDSLPDAVVARLEELQKAELSEATWVLQHMARRRRSNK